MPRKTLYPKLTGTIPQRDWDKQLLQMLEALQNSDQPVPVPSRSWRVITPISRVRH